MPNQIKKQTANGLSVVSMEGFDWLALIDMQERAGKRIRNSGLADTSASSILMEFS
ncbi:hypothetical protein [Brevibacillus borstelensis]|uniref:hypothetical protein n=1 Tax=Brevibacillus borstelensis TaxID=45462 RepID=UPI00203E6AB5|nr:hypothetical protein [Brevibacillus borstelensis]MCM3470178.1 hypothetical protein [Brevibacillus borstelensis]MCM3591244.1 hypothetical protein [Brevibacillus borstelensis]